LAEKKTIICSALTATHNTGTVNSLTKHDHFLVVPLQIQL